MSIGAALMRVDAQIEYDDQVYPGHSHKVDGLQLTRVLGLSANRVSELFNDGTLPRPDADNRYDLTEVRTRLAARSALCGR